MQRRHVDEVGQVSAAEAGGAARDHLQVVRQMAGESQGAAYTVLQPCVRSMQLTSKDAK